MSELVVGSVLQSYVDFDRVPIGTVITPNNGGLEFVRHLDGWRRADNNAVLGVRELSLGYNKIKSIPKGAVTWESLAQWQWRYRDNAYTSAQSAGVETETVTQAMVDLGIGDDRFPLGRGVIFANEHDRYRVEAGTQVMVGEPDRLESYGLFVKRHGDHWVHLLGEVNNVHGYRMQIVSGPDVEWATAPGTAEEQAALAQFKAKAWRVGWKVKVHHRWCETYESYMAQIGLTEDVLQHVEHGGITVGETVNSQGAALLPEGSILRWHHRSVPNTFTWYIRDDSARNEARTRVLFGHRDDGLALRNAGSAMEVMHITNEESVMNVRVDNLAEIWDHLPVGTVVSNGGASRYAICEDHLVADADARSLLRGTWSLAQLGENVAIVGFPS